MKILAILILFSGAWVQAAVSLDLAWPVFSIRVDVTNVIGEHGEGRISESDMMDRLGRASEIWSQCGIRFVVHSAVNLPAGILGVPYAPRSQEDVVSLAKALNPHGYTGAIPVVFAGPWHFYDSTYHLYLHGLGWALWNGTQIDQIAATIDAEKAGGDLSGVYIGHEIGHALSLPESSDGANVMSGGRRLQIDQCLQVRAFSHDILSAFLETPLQETLRVAQFEGRSLERNVGLALF